MANPPETPQQVVFLLGAGASVDAGVPGTVGFVSEFYDHLRRKRWYWRGKGLRLLRFVERRIREWSELPGNEGKQLDVESLLDTLALYREGSTNIRSVFARQNVSPTPGDVEIAALLEAALKDFIRDRCFVNRDRTGYLRPLLRLISDERPLEVFTVNYDLVVEQFLGSYGRTFTDGFELTWAPELFDEPNFDVRLYKLHGSATWFSTPFGSVVKLPLRDIFREATLFSGEAVDSLMLYPTQKFLYTATFLELFRRFQIAISRCTWLIAVGYTFRDEQIVRSVLEASKLNPNLHVVLIGPSSESIYDSQLRSIALSPERSLFNPAESTIASPLEGRVARMPFNFKPTLPVLFTEILPILRDARRFETVAQSAEIYGPTPQWREAARRYVRAGFLDKAAAFESAKFRLDDQDEMWRLGYFLERSIAEVTHADVRDARESWRTAIKLLREIMIDRGRVEFGFQGTQIQTRFLYAVKLTPQGQIQSGQSPEGLSRLFQDALELATRSLKLVSVEDRIRRLRAMTQVVIRISENTVGLTNQLGQLDLTDYIDARPSPTKGRLRSLQPSIVSISPPNFNSQIYEGLAARMTAIERGYLGSKIFRQWRFD